MNMDDLAAEIHTTAVEKDFWKHEQITTPAGYGVAGPLMANPSFDAEKIALMHSELSEALEALRDNDWPQVEEELADTIIRILDFAHARELSMDRAVSEKMAKNRKRPRLHGRSW